MTVADALAHPTWKMGPKITVDSSTLMNKGLEVIEAHLLFGAGYDQIDVVVHPQSVVHSMVEMTDGATMAQLSLPDMRLPIGYALSYPERMATAFGAIDWAAVDRLDFEVPDPVAFRCLPLAYEVGPAGRHGPGGPERRQRGGRRRLPKRKLEMGRYTFGDRGCPGQLRPQRAAGPGRRAGRRCRRPGRGRLKAWRVAVGGAPRRRPVTSPGPPVPEYRAADAYRGVDGGEVMDQREQRGALLRLAVVVVAGLVVAQLFGALATVLVVLALLVVIVLHELGHFVAAKRAGMKVSEFFVGFGPRLWSVRKGETTYGIKALPLGGYCRIIGMTNVEKVDPADEARAYRNQPTWRRLTVVCAGSFVHFVLAFLMLVVLFLGPGDIGNFITQPAVRQPDRRRRGLCAVGPARHSWPG